MIKLITKTAIVVIAVTTLFFLNSCSTPTSQRKLIDKLDSVKVDTGIVKELKDVYRVFRINETLDNTKGDFSYYYNSDSIVAANILKTAISKCDSLKNSPFYDDSIRIFCDRHIDAFNVINKIIIKHGLMSQTMQDSLVGYQKISDEYDHYLFGKYSTDHFIKISEDEYWKRIDKQQFIKSPEYAKYLSLSKTDLNGSLELLKKIISNTNNFQEKTIYQMELANSMIIHKSKLDSNSINSAIDIYSSILNNKEYSLYKFESWRRWRAAMQAFKFGQDSEDSIPNNLYDAKREECASQILSYYVQNPKDEMALNQFLDFATHGIIYRVGVNEDGNQNKEDFAELFKLEDKKKK